jgi:hypothetical protein
MYIHTYILTYIHMYIHTYIHNVAGVSAKVTDNVNRGN